MEIEEFILRYEDFHIRSTEILNDLMTEIDNLKNITYVKLKSLVGIDEPEEKKSLVIIANKEILDTFKIESLSDYGREIISKVTLETINLYNKQKKKRNSGAHYAVHPISVGYIIKELNLPYYVLAAAINHDNIEEKAEHEKKVRKIKSDDNSSLETLTNKLFEKQFILSLKAAKSAKKSLSGYNYWKIFDSKLHEKELRELVYSSIILQKVTRIESDKNYYQSIERIFDKDISKETICFKAAFEGYKAETDKELTFSDGEITHLIESAACVKLADRISNTLDTYEGQSFTKRIKDVYKSLYMINSVTEYMNNVKNNSKVRRRTYQKMKYLKHVLIESNRRIIKDALEGLNPAEKGVFIEAFEEYKNKEKGFYSLDYGFSGYPHSGIIIGVWNEIISNNESVIERVNNNTGLQYLALTALEEINNLFGEDEKFSLSGFGKLASENELGYMDRIGDLEQKGRPGTLWEKKQKYREYMGVKSYESFHEKYPDTPLDRMPDGMVDFQRKTESEEYIIPSE